ncbi:MAG: hypothetical protein KJO24_06955 [Gammaproteobacteria bacterium]|nr:hypothetical protein [Gammaproteobacteria bacterium]
MLYRKLLLACAALSVVPVVLLLNSPNGNSPLRPAALPNKASAPPVSTEPPAQSTLVTPEPNEAAAQVAATAAPVALPSPTSVHTGSVVAEPILTREQLIERAVAVQGQDRFAELIANKQLTDRQADGFFNIDRAGIAYGIRLTTSEIGEDLPLRIKQSGLTSDEQAPLVRVAGGGKRFKARAQPAEDALLIYLPAEKLAQGPYIIDINYLQPKTAAQRRFVLSLELD